MPDELKARYGHFFMLIDREGRVLYASPAIQAGFGIEADSALGPLWSTHVHPEDADRLFRWWEKVIADPGCQSQVDFRAQVPGGRWALVEMAAINLLELPSVQAVVLHLHDASAERQVHARLKALMAGSYDVVVTVAPDGTILWATPNSQRMLGYTPSQLEGRNCLELVHPTDVTSVAEILLEFGEGHGVPSPRRLKVLHGDGTWCDVEAVANDFLANPDVGGVTVSLRRIDERVELEGTQKRLTDIFELTDDFVVTCGLDGRVVYMNSALRRFLFGSEPPRDRIDLQDWLAPQEIARLSVEVPAALAANAVWSGEVVLHGPQGTEVPVHAQVVGHKDAGGDLAFFSAVGRDIRERKAFEARLAHEATHDPLTSLPNRSLLLERLSAALARGKRRGSTTAVLFCDLDNFKIVNDSRGHSKGDHLLVMVAERLRGQLRPEDTIGRFGGDEFVIICEDVDGSAGAISIAKRVEHAFGEPFDLDGVELHLGVSLGIALDTSGMSEPEALIRDADAAMYEAKARGRGRFELFEPGMFADAEARFGIANALYGALERGELELHYQPIYDRRPARSAGYIEESGGGNGPDPKGELHPVGVEALLRWHHPQLGLLYPDDFIDVAEDTGIIVPLGSWVLTEACRQLASWGRRPGWEQIRMSVNVSGRQLERPGIVDQVATIIDDTGVVPQRLELEITESAIMRDAERMREVLDGLAQLGVSLVVDDFGTGYSSLSHLRRFPVNSLKVDRSFIDGLGAKSEDSAIVSAIVNLAHSLGMTAVAEGVETPEQQAALAALGCDLLQGFLLSRPVPENELESLLGAGETEPSG